MNEKIPVLAVTVAVVLILPSVRLGGIVPMIGYTESFSLVYHAE